MLSPVSKRIVSPSKQLSSSPRGNRRKFSGSDMLCAAFLKYFKWLVAGAIGLSFVRIITMEPFSDMDDFASSSNNYTHSVRIDPDAPSTVRKTASPNTVPIVYRDSDWNEEEEDSEYDESEAEYNRPIDDSSYGNVDATTIEAPVPVDTTIAMTTNENNELTSSPSDLSSYKASNSPVILDGWKRTVQVHLIVDVTASADIDPASKLLLAAVERSSYTQIKALTFVRPAVQTFEMFPRNPQLPLLFLVDWGSMNRDCHRLQLVLEDIRMQHALSSHTSADETEEPYFLLIDSSGSTRQTGCNLLFQNIANDENTGYMYAHTRDKNRIRLAKRSIVQNRYYDSANKKIHGGEVAPNHWAGTPQDYDRPVLHSPFSLRESFASGVQDITGGKKFIFSNKRPVDVGFFWNSGDYSYYGFYRRDIAKVVKTLHHSTLKGKVLNTEVGIVYSDVKEMNAGHVQVKYLERILLCKIVVIAQRDEWEDHYRLMESLASGALVMTDSMVALPEGLEDGVNIVVYDSPQMLKDLIRHYLNPKHKDARKKIATNGYKLAMGRHRCWHRLEELLFGKPLTNANKPHAPAPPKEKVPGL